MEAREKKARILLAKPGLDGHDRGIKVVARALKDAGFEVIYAGLRQTPEMIVRTAADEAVDGIGLSILSGAHMTLLPDVARLARAGGLGDVRIFAGGIIPSEDIPVLKDAGISEIFGPGTTLLEIVEWAKHNV